MEEKRTGVIVAYEDLDGTVQGFTEPSRHCHVSGTPNSFYMMNAGTSFCGSGTMTHNFDTSY